MVGGWTDMDQYTKEEEAWRELEKRQASMVKPSKADDDLEATLDQRGDRYGPFVGHARITQGIKAVMFNSRDDLVLDADQREALEMIAHKIGRIINGDPHYADSWLDIAGYAKLVADRLQGRER